MSDLGGYTDEMGHSSEPSDEDLDRLLSGLAPAGAGFDELAALVRDVQAACSAASDGMAEDRHVMPIVAAAQLLEPQDTVAPRSRRWTGGLPAWRRRTVFGSLFASLTAKIAGVAVASTMAAGGLAATGTLPDPAQTAVANVVEKVGITIPNPDKAARTQEKADAKVTRTQEKADEKIARTEDEDKIARTEQKAADKIARTEQKAADRIVRTEAKNEGDYPGKGVRDYVHKALQEQYNSGREKGDAVSDAASPNRPNGTDDPAAEEQAEEGAG